ncbi:MAG: PilN domain-containing protein [Tissierellaceae bacterium]
MRDLNFFEPYIEKKEFRIDRKLIYFTLSSFLVLLLTVYFIFNAIVIRQETRIVESLRSTAEDPKTLEKVNEIKEKEVEVNDFRNSVDKITQLDKTIENRDIVDESLLNDITSKIPDDLSLTSLSIHNREVNIVGVSRDKWSIAEFGKGMENLGIHEDIFISNISLQETYYNFSINMVLRGESDDGE